MVQTRPVTHMGPQLLICETRRTILGWTQTCCPVASAQETLAVPLPGVPFAGAFWESSSERPHPQRRL